MAAGNQGAAVVELKNALQKEPDSTEARLLLAEAALWLGDARGAERELGTAEDPPDARRDDARGARRALREGEAKSR